jgi:PAP2 superfamily
VRNAVAASTAICLLISLVPVAPPRMLTSLGFVDLAARYGQSVYVALGSTAGADQLSAMPSVHVAWAVLVVAAQALVTRSAVTHRSVPLPALRQRHGEPQDGEHAGQHRGDQAGGNRAGDEIHDKQHRDQHGACHRG